MFSEWKIIGNYIYGSDILLRGSLDGKSYGGDMAAIGEILVSVGRNDCEWSYTRGSGAGGQKRNKTSSAVHCFHEPSGARGYSEAGRSQLHNRQDAFRKMVESGVFQKWLKIESARKMGLLYDIEKRVEEMMQEKNLKIEGKIDGRWVEGSDY